MAKVKSKKITLEEALVPAEEQPYKVPENWCWTYLLNGFAECKDGNRKPINASERAEREGDIPYYGATGQAGWIDDYLTDEQLVLLGEDGAPFLELLKDKAYLIEGKAWVNNHAHIIKSHYGEVGDKYILHYLNVFNFHGYVNGTTRLKLTQASMRTIPVPLPPLAEQKRIVEQIESLFAKLDEAKEKALSVVESFESRKKAILNNAFNGLYSTDWREKHHCTLADWKDRKINEICIPRAGFAFNSKKFTESGIQIIRMGNLYAGKLNLSRSPVFYDISDVDDNIIKRSMVHDGDILLTLTGTKYKRDYGYAVCIEGEHELLVNQRILCLSPTEKIDKEYLLYYLRSEIFRDIFFSNETGGVNQGNVSLKFVENIEIKLPSIEEQKEISKILKNILTKEEQAKELAEFVIEQIELMKKSILAKAFRGELGTNIATEESAIELLKSIL